MVCVWHMRGPCGLYVTYGRTLSFVGDIFEDNKVLCDVWEDFKVCM